MNHSEEIDLVAGTPASANRVGGIPPERVLAWARSCPVAVTRFIGLVTYFFSMRGIEATRLRKNRFLEGDEVEEMECARVMHSAGLYNKLVVRVNIRADSWVCCFNEEAAGLIRELLADPKLDGELAALGRGGLAREWELHGIGGVSISALRSASIHWLIETDALHSELVRKHARLKTYMAVMNNWNRTRNNFPRPVEVLPPRTSPLNIRD